MQNKLQELTDKILENPEIQTFIQDNGFEGRVVQKEKAIHVPDDILSQYLNAEQLADFRNGDTGIFSITVFAQKPLAKACCEPGCC